jgi:hypothetical protein
MKQLLALFISLTFSVQMSAQDTTIVLINNKIVAEAIIIPDQAETALLIRKMKYQKQVPFMIVVSGEYIRGEVYKRSLEIAGENSIIFKETKNKPGHFDISASATAEQLLDGKKIPLYLLVSPSNPAMMMPSRRVFLGNLVMK